MSAITTPPEPDIDYPDSDGMPMAQNTLQYEWIVTLKGNLDLLFADRPDVFVAGDNLVYPVRGNNTIRQAPDVYVALGRPKGYRGSYKVWEEGGLFPQVVFEVWSPGNRAGEMTRKRAFYRTHGAEELYLIYPDDNLAEGWVRDGESFKEITGANGFVSPLLGIRFAHTESGQLAVFYPDGRRFLTFADIGELAERAQQQVTAAQRENDRLREMLRAAGIDPGQPSPG